MKIRFERLSYKKGEWEITKTNRPSVKPRQIASSFGASLQITQQKGLARSTYFFWASDIFIVEPCQGTAFSLVVIMERILGKKCRLVHLNDV